MGRPRKDQLTKVQPQKGARKANQSRAEKKRLPDDKEGGTLTSEEKQVVTTSTSEQKSSFDGPLFYRCLSDPGDVKQRSPGQGIPYCRFCGRPMVRVGAVGREKRDRM